jgi:predicted TIM-barrel fold metal-dependent hydrolase
MRVPPGAWDCQIHIFEDPARFPMRAQRAYDPPGNSTFADAHAMHRTLGIAHGVIVQSTAHGTDPALLLHALAQAPEYRGLAVIDDTVDDNALQALDAAGVRGARFNFWSKLNLVPDLAGFERSMARIAKLGWHVKIHAEPDDLVRLVPKARAYAVPVVIDHLGKVDTSRGADTHDCDRVVELLADDGVWMMLSSGVRMSAHETLWPDAEAVIRRYVEAAPDRCIWGTDWPRIAYQRTMPNDADLIELLWRASGSVAAFENILVANPRRLFDGK